MAKFKTAKSATVDIGYPVGTAQVGGNTAITGNQMQPAVKVGANAADTGYIILKKGATKFLVSDDSGNEGVCALANTDSGNLAANTMSITCTYANAATFFASRITNKFVWNQTDDKYLVGITANASTTPATVAVTVA